MGASKIISTSFDITIVGGRSSQTKIIKANMHLTDLFIEVPVLATAKKIAKLVITTERGNIPFAVNELDASSAKTYPIRLSKSIMGAITLEITTDAIVTGDKTFTIELRGYGWVVSDSAEQDGYYYAKLGSTNLYGLEHPSFRITEELNKIPSFEFEIANCSDNRTAIAAGITEVFRIYRRIYSVDTLMFTGIINGDAIEYLSLERIRITGYASYIDLNWRFHQHLNSADAENVNKIFDYDGSYTDYTTAANNDTINDVLATFGDTNHAFYIGGNNIFWGAQIKYSTAGIADTNSTIVIEYSKGSGVWATLDVLDESKAFTKTAGTYYLIIPHLPSDWARNEVNSVTKYWIRYRLSSVDPYILSPRLDRIKITNIDVYRVYYFETAADTIMDEVLAGTGYSMDVTDACPSDTISIVAEYETKLRIVAGIANALTWDDSGDKKGYQWWIDTSKKVHLKQKRGATLGDITGELTILNNIKDYFNLSNRLHFFGNYDGLNQLRASIEDIDSQDTHEIRELAVPEERYNNYIPLKEAAQKAMAYTKAPLQKIAATVTTKYWLDNSFEVGDTVTLHATSWDVASQAFQIVRADIGARVTNLDIGISQEHLDALKAGLQRQLDITGIRMHGSTSLMQFGPETMNYQRVDTTTVYPSRLKIEIHSDVRYIHKVLLSWTIGPYRADVEPDTGLTSGHDHTGYTGSSSAHDHTGATGLDGGHTPTEIGTGSHDHTLDLVLVKTSRAGYLVSQKYVYSAPNHTHPKGVTSLPDDVVNVVTGLTYGSWCDVGECVQGTTHQNVADDSHWHLNTGLNTGAAGLHEHNLYTATTVKENYIYAIGIGSNTASTDPDHTHTINYVADHTNPITSQAGESLTVATEPGESVTVEYGIHEEAAGTTLELLVNSEVVASSYVGDQTDIRIDGYLSTGNNTVEIRPIVGENGKKGSCTVLAAGIFFIEAKKF